MHFVIRGFMGYFASFFFGTAFQQQAVQQYFNSKLCNSISTASCATAFQQQVVQQQVVHILLLLAGTTKLQV